MKFVFITAVSHPLFDGLVRHLRERGCVLDSIVLAPLKSRGLARLASAALRALRTVAGQCRSHTDLSLHFVGQDTLLLAVAGRAFGKRIHLHFWGTDIGKFMRLPAWMRDVLLRSATTITFATEALRDKVLASHPKAQPAVRITPFGLPVLDDIDRVRAAGASAQATGTTVVCGTNASANQQLLEMIPQLERFAASRPAQDIEFVFPLGYGDPVHKEQVKQRLASSPLNYRLVEDFLSGEALGRFRIGTHVLVQVQRQDALSGAMLETLYAGGRVITGSWLPYGVLREHGVDWIEVDALDGLPGALARALDTPFNLEANQRIVKSLYSWSAAGDAWAEALFQGECRGKGERPGA